MEVFLWIVLGIIAGLIVASAINDGRRFVYVEDILFGVVGAILGGFIIQHLTASNNVGLYDETTVFVVLGAAILIWFGRKIIHHKFIT